jgi:hypothetical protein
VGPKVSHVVTDIRSRVKAYFDPANEKPTWRNFGDIVNDVQRLLEIIDKAPEVFGRKKGDKIIWASPPPWKDYGEFTGKIVCIEEKK